MRNARPERLPTGSCKFTQQQWNRQVAESVPFRGSPFRRHHVQWFQPIGCNEINGPVREWRYTGKWKVAVIAWPPTWYVR